MQVHGKILVRNFKVTFKDELGVGTNIHHGFSTGSYAEDGATLDSIRGDKAAGAGGELTDAKSLRLAALRAFLGIPEAVWLAVVAAVASAEPTLKVQITMAASG